LARSIANAICFSVNFDLFMANQRNRHVHAEAKHF